MNAPSLLTGRSSPALSCSTTDPDSPDTVPPTEYVTGGFGFEGLVPSPDALVSLVLWPDGFEALVLSLSAVGAPEAVTG